MSTQKNEKTVHYRSESHRPRAFTGTPLRPLIGIIFKNLKKGER
jgi:hypothetical protein